MKTTEFRKLIREEVRKAISLNEGVSWDKQSITNFFNFLKKIGVAEKVRVTFVSDMTGKFKMESGGFPLEALFQATANTLTLTEQPFSDFAIEDLAQDIENEADRLPAIRYDVKLNGKKMMVKKA